MKRIDQIEINHQHNTITYTEREWLIARHREMVEALRDCLEEMAHRTGNNPTALWRGAMLDARATLAKAEEELP